MQVFTTRGYKRFPRGETEYGVTRGLRGFKRLQGGTRGYRRVKGITRGYKKLQGVTRGYRGRRRVTGLQKV